MAQMRLTMARFGGAGVTLFEFRPVNGGNVEPFTAGAHVDVTLPNGLVRPYSLASDPRERRSYLLGVKNEPASRGGSRYMHEMLRVGAVLEIGTPRNLFPLDETAECTVFVAGGIGITPIRSMIHRAYRILTCIAVVHRP